jgi:hypothetical protein
MMVFAGMLYFPNVSLPQMPSQTRAHDDAGTSRGREDTPNRPPVPPTLAEAIAALVNGTADNTRFLCKMTGNQFQPHGGRAPPQGPRETTYLEFCERPPLFIKAEEPLEADEWVRVMEQKFGLIHCTETQKPLFAAQQLRGPTITCWANFVAIQPTGHQITWEEFKLALREHYVPEGVLHMKKEEFIRLKQGGDTIMQYLNKFNLLSQYAIDQVNTDMKKKNCFMRGLNDRLQRKMAMCLDLTYSRAASTALAVEAKNAGHGKSTGFGGERSNQGPEKRTRLVIRPFSQNRSSPRLTHLHIHSSNLFLFVPLLPSLLPISRVPLVLVSLLFPVLPLVASIVDSPDTSSRTAHTRSKIKPISNRTLGTPTKERGIRLILQRA